MPRYHRVNIDGDSLFKTETRRVATAPLLPGTFAVMSVISGVERFVQAPTGTVGRVYCVDVGTSEGLLIGEAIPVDHSAVGNYVEEGREMAVLVAAGTYTKDQPFTVGANGRAVPGTTGVIGYSQDAVTLTAPDFIRLRMRSAAPAA